MMNQPRPASMEMTSRQSSATEANRRAAVWIGLFAFALALRLITLWQTNDVATSRHPVGDAAGYVEGARQIADGDWLGSHTFYQAPLYPYLMACAFKTLGQNLWIIKGIQCIGGALAAILLFYAFANWFNAPTGLVAAMMLAASPMAIYYDVILQKASLSCFLICALLAAISPSAARGWQWMFSGIILGLLVLTRENTLIWLPVLLVYAYSKGARRWRGAGCLNVATFLIGVACILAPVAARNRIVGGEWSISTFQAGSNFYIGNHAGADGRYVPLVRGRETPEFERVDAIELAQRDLGRALSPREVSRYWFGRAWDDIHRDPIGWITLMGRKLLMVVNQYEVADAESLIVYAEASVVLAFLQRVWQFGVLFPLAAAGVVFTWPIRGRLLVLHALLATMIGAVAAFYVLGRYRFPLVPLLIPFAAAASVSAWNSIRGRRFRELAAPVAALLMAAAISHLPLHDQRRLDALSRMNAGVALARTGDIAGAVLYFQAAVRGHPDSAEAHNNLGQALAFQGDFSAAVKHYKLALALAPDLMGVQYNLGVALERLGNLEEALHYYQSAAMRDPLDQEATTAVNRLLANN